MLTLACVLAAVAGVALIASGLLDLLIAVLMFVVDFVGLLTGRCRDDE